MDRARPFAGADNAAARGVNALLALLLLAFGTLASAAPTFPALTGRVVDAANVLPPATVAELSAKLEALETATGTQLVVATVPSLQDNDISDYAYQLGRAWGIGQKGTNNGAVLLVAPVERKVWVATGYGMEERLTDSLSETIIQRDILPRFKAGDMPGGIVAGTDALIAQLQLPPGEARAQVAAAAVQPRARHHSSGAGGFVWLAIVLIWLFFSMFRGRRGRSSGIGNAILWGVASSVLSSGSRGSSWGGGGGGSDWGGGGGGGFSGGGGSFGGGGAGGSW
jgi:uncharacterized protein